MKKFFVLLLAVAGALSANAQFEKGTWYSELNLNGLGMGYSHNDFAIGFGGTAGYYLADSHMVAAGVGFNHAGAGDNRGYIKALYRYSFKSNGINLGGGLQYEHSGNYMDYVQICPQVGYTFYLNHFLSLDPAIYSDICMNDIKYGTNFGLKIGIGFYYKKSAKVTKKK